MAIIVKHTKVSTVPDSADTSLVRPSDWNADHTLTGLGTAAALDAGVANGVATLDSAGKVPVSQIPQMGDLNYQGTWNASTNTPTLASSTGTKGYYYVVNVAGTTNLDGITDWKVGDWAVFNGTAWQKIDNTDSVTSVNGYTGTVVLGVADISGAANAPTNTNITSMTGVTGGISSPDFIQFDTTYATTLAAGQLGWDGNNTLGLGMIGGNVVQKIGEDQFFYTKATAAISKGEVVMFTGSVGASGVPTGAPATGIADGTYIMGIASENIALNGFGLVQTFGTLRNVNTSGYTDGEILWYNPAVTGGLTATKPSAPNVKVQMAAVINGGLSGGGTILIRIDPGSQLGGTDSNVQIGTLANNDLLQYDSTAQYWKNVTPASVTGVGSVANAVTFNSSGTGDASGTTFNGSAAKTVSYNTIGAQPAGTYVTSVAATVPSFLSVSGSPITSSGTLAITYSGTALPVANGGTGLTSVTSTYIPYGNGTSALSVSSNFTFDGSTLKVTADQHIRSGYGLAYFDSTNANYWAQYNSSGNFIFSNGTERMRIDTSGNVGIGALSPYNATTDVLTVRRRQNTITQIVIDNQDTGSSAQTRLALEASGGGWYIANQKTGNPLTFTNVTGEKIRFDSLGNFLVGTADATRTAGAGVKIGYVGSTLGTVSCVKTASTNGDDTLHVFSTGAGAYRFYVDMGGTVHATSTSIAAISDASLKENIRDLETGLPEIMALKPRRFDWINGDATNVAGFIAQEVEDVLPELVIDSLYSQDDDGNPITKKNLKMGDILPTLVKAIQELSAKVDAQAAEIAALKSA